MRSRGNGFGIRRFRIGGCGVLETVPQFERSAREHFHQFARVGGGIGCNSGRSFPPPQFDFIGAGIVGFCRRNSQLRSGYFDDFDRLLRNGRRLLVGRLLSHFQRFRPLPRTWTEFGDRIRSGRFRADVGRHRIRIRIADVALFDLNDNGSIRNGYRTLLDG